MMIVIKFVVAFFSGYSSSIKTSISSVECDSSGRNIEKESIEGMIRYWLSLERKNFEPRKFFESLAHLFCGKYRFI
jgi:hypothetical protein